MFFSALLLATQTVAQSVTIDPSILNLGATPQPRSNVVMTTNLPVSDYVPGDPRRYRDSKAAMTIHLDRLMAKAHSLNSREGSYIAAKAMELRETVAGLSEGGNFARNKDRIVQRVSVLERRLHRASRS